jgi:hypothetical protein
VQTIVHKLAESTGAREAYWQYFPSGWFGDKLVEGTVSPEERVLVFNGVTQQGRCVGERLPSFVEAMGAKIIAAAVLAKGTSPAVALTEQRFGDKFYAAVKTTININTPEACEICKTGTKLVPWTQVRDRL